MASAIVAEKFWVDKARFNNAERQYYENLNKNVERHSLPPVESPVDDVLSCVVAQKKVKAKKSKKCRSNTEVSNPDTSLIIGDLNKHSDGNRSETSDQKANVKKNKKKNKSNTNNNKKPCETISALPCSPPTILSSSNPLHSTAATNMVKKSDGSKAKGTASNSQCTLVSEIAKAREHIKNSLEKMDGIASLAATPVTSDVLDRIVAVEKENASLKDLVAKLNSLCIESQNRIAALETQLTGSANKTNAAPAPAAVNAKSDPEDDDGVDLFASDSEEESAEAARIREERLSAYAAKKSKKPTIIAKSSLVLDVKPWDDETDLKVMESEIRKISADGLLWGASKFVPVAFGIQKLSISCVVEDEKISIDWLTEEIEKFEDFVQSVDVAAFNKI